MKKTLLLMTLLVAIATGAWARTVYVYPKGWESFMSDHFVAAYYWIPTANFPVLTADTQHENCYQLDVPDQTSVVILLLVPNGLEVNWDNYTYQTINCDISPEGGDPNDILLVITGETQTSSNGNLIYLVERTTLSEYFKPDTKATYSIDLISEYKSVPTVYAGSPNYFTLKVENIGEAAGSNVHASVYNDGILIWDETIDNIPAGETKSLDVTDWTIRPVTENTVIGNDNENTLYKVVVEDADGSTQNEYSFVVLYNGNLGKEYAYTTSTPLSRAYSFNGDVQVLVGDGYSSSNATSRDDAFAVSLNGGSIHKALLYVAYNWDKVSDGDFNSWTTSFNGTPVTPLAYYRDQSNLGTYGSYGYGLVVYDVTAAVVDGSNTFALGKTAGNVQVYPSSLIVMVENPSGKPQNVYLVEDADLLSTTYNKNVNAIYASSFQGVADGKNAQLYVFAAGAQAGEGDLTINDNLYTDIWKGTSQSVDVFETSVEPGDVSVQFKATGSTILALQQMLVVSSDDTSIGTVKADNASDAINYDLQGRKATNSSKGIRIQNGKKIVVK